MASDEELQNQEMIAINSTQMMVDNILNRFIRHCTVIVKLEATRTASRAITESLLTRIFLIVGDLVDVHIACTTRNKVRSPNSDFPNSNMFFSMVMKKDEGL